MIREMKMVGVSIELGTLIFWYLSNASSMKCLFHIDARYRKDIAVSYNLSFITMS